MIKWLRYFYFRGFVRTFVLIVLGLNVRHRERLPSKGPAVVIANHNSHLDTMVLMTLLPASLLPKIQPVAALDYFLSSKPFAWFALNILGILPIKRRGKGKAKGRDENPLQGCLDALDEGKVLIFFPEGSRGEPERLAEFKNGIARLSQARPDVPITPVFMHGLGKALPRGETLLVPFFCDVVVGEKLDTMDDKGAFMTQLDARLHDLSEELVLEGRGQAWE